MKWIDLAEIQQNGFIRIYRWTGFFQDGDKRGTDLVNFFQEARPDFLKSVGIEDDLLVRRTFGLRMGIWGGYV